MCKASEQDDVERMRDVIVDDSGGRDRTQEQCGIGGGNGRHADETSEGQIPDGRKSPCNNAVGYWENGCSPEKRLQDP